MLETKQIGAEIQKVTDAYRKGQLLLDDDRVGRLRRAWAAATCKGETLRPPGGTYLVFPSLDGCLDSSMVFFMGVQI